jgi:peroxiredoxin
LPKGGEITIMAITKGRTSTSNQTKTLKVGDVAPDFALKSHSGQDFKLSDLKGKKNVVLAFFPFAFTPV